MDKRGISYWCGLAGALSGAAIGYLHLQKIAGEYGIDLSDWYQQLPYPLLTLLVVFVYLCFLIAVCTFVFHLPFLLSNRMSITVVFKSILGPKLSQKIYRRWF